MPKEKCVNTNYTRVTYVVLVPIEIDRLIDRVGPSCTLKS